MFLQRWTDHVGRVDEDFASLRDSRHHDVPELVVIAVRHRGGEEELRPAEVHLVAVGHLDRLRIRLELADECARTLPLTPVDMELAVLQEGELAAEDGRRCGVVMVVMVVADREDVRLFRSLSNDLPQFLLAGALRRMRGGVVAVRAKSDARVARRARSSACFAVYSTPPGWLISTTTNTSFPPAASTQARTESSPTKPWQMIPDAPASTACSTMSRFVFGMSAILKSHRT